MFARSYYFLIDYYSEIGRLSYHNTKKNLRVAFTMQCNSEKFQLSQIAFLTETCEGINST